MESRFFHLPQTAHKGHNRLLQLHSDANQPPDANKKMDLLALYDQIPNIQVTITLKDLLDAQTTLLDQAKAALEQQISDAHADNYISTEKVKEMMGVSTTTLWRWKQRGYLVPVRIGGNDRYRMKDVQRIMEGGSNE